MVLLSIQASTVFGDSCCSIATYCNPSLLGYGEIAFSPKRRFDFVCVSDGACCLHVQRLIQLALGLRVLAFGLTAGGHKRRSETIKSKMRIPTAFPPGLLQQVVP